MTIKILGSGCPTCELLYDKVKKLEENGKIEAEIECIKDVNELIGCGIMSSPTLLIDEKFVFAGALDNDEKLLVLIKKNS